MSDFPNKDLPLSGNFPNPLDGIHKMSGMKQHEHHKIVEAAVKMMGVKSLELNEAERLVAEARQRLKNVNDYANAVHEGHIADGIKFVPEKLAAEIFEKFLANFDHYQRDQLLLFLARFMTELVMSKIV